MKANIALMLALVLGMWGCAAVNVDYDRGVDFNQYKSFAWLPAEVNVKNPKHNSELIQKRIKHTVEKEFGKRGIRIDNTDPDFLVGYHTYTEKKQRTIHNNIHPMYGAWGWGWYHPYRFPFAGAWGMPYGGWMNAPQVRTYTEGTLIVDVFDAKTKELVWRGSVDGDIENMNRLQKQIDKGVQAVLKKYPVKPGQLDAPEEVAPIAS
jgi:hypothetical protein